MAKALFVTRSSLARLQGNLSWKEGRLIHAPCGSALSEVVTEREIRSPFAAHTEGGKPRPVSDPWCRTCEATPPNGDPPQDPLRDRDIAEVVL